MVVPAVRIRGFCVDCYEIAHVVQYGGKAPGRAQHVGRQASAKGGGHFVREVEDADGNTLWRAAA
jgi:hypothetical protein